MNHHPQIHRPITLNAVAQPGRLLPDHSRQVMLYHDRGVLEAWYWGELPVALPGRLLKAVAYIVPVYDPKEKDTHYVVTRFDWCENMDAFALAAPTLGTQADDVYRCRDLIAGVQHPAVRRLLSDVFTEPSVFFGFWTAPCLPSIAEGSLVRNAVALGEHFRDRAFLPQDHRDLGVAYAILRDIGNVWSHAAKDSGGSHTNTLRLALERLDGPLTHFDAVCPVYAPVLHELIHACKRAPTNQRAKVLLRYASEVTITADCW